MRQIHPTSLQEKFVASGVYITQYQEWQEDHLDTERWTIHELPDQSQLIRIDRENVGNYWNNMKLTLLIEALRNSPHRGRTIERLDIYLYYSSENISDKRVIATYLFFDEYIQVSLRVDNRETLHSEVPRKKGSPVFTEANILKGFAATQVMQERNSTESTEIIFVGKIYPEIYDDEKLLSPFIGSVHTFLNPSDSQVERIDIAHTLFIAKKYDLVFGFVKGPLRRFWVDEHDVLLKLEDDVDSASSILTQYARRPG